MAEHDGDVPSVCLVTMRGGATVQNATYLLMNVIAELTEVSLVTTRLADDSRIHGRYDVEEVAEGAAAGGLLATVLVFLQNQIRIARAVRRSDADVVYFFGGLAYVLPVAVAAASGRTVVVQLRGDVPLTLRLDWSERYPDALAGALAGLVAVLERVSLWLADGVVTYTESMAAELGVDRYGDKLYPDGARYVEVDDFAPHVPYEDRPLRVGMIGRLDVEKGVDAVAGAVEHLPDDVAVRFVGDGDLRPWIEEELAEAIDAGRVELTGWVDHDEVADQLNALKLLILASEPTEGLPTAIQEAFACGTPVYATPVSGIPDVVREGETGFLMRDRSPEAIAEDVAAILDRDDLDAISANCRDQAVERWSFDAAVDRFERLLTDVA